MLEILEGGEPTTTVITPSLVTTYKVEVTRPRDFKLEAQMYR